MCDVWRLMSVSARVSQQPCEKGELMFDSTSCRLTRQRLGDDHLLDVAGALVDVEQPGVTVAALHNHPAQTADSPPWICTARSAVRSGRTAESHRSRLSGSVTTCTFSPCRRPRGDGGLQHRGDHRRREPRHRSPLAKAARSPPPRPGACAADRRPNRRGHGHRARPEALSGRPTLRRGRRRGPGAGRRPRRRGSAAVRGWGSRGRPSRRSGAGRGPCWRCRCPSRGPVRPRPDD